MNDQAEVRDIRRRDWYWIAHELIKRHGTVLKAHGIAVYNLLCLHADHNGTSTTSMAVMAREVGMSSRQVRREVDKLQQLGLVAITRRPTGVGLQHETNVYTLLNVIASTDSQSRVPEGADTQSVPTGHTVRTVRTASPHPADCVSALTTTTEQGSTTPPVESLVPSPGVSSPNSVTSPAPLARAGGTETAQHPAPSTASQRSRGPLAQPTSAADRARDPAFDRFCLAYGYDPQKPATRVRGLAGDHSARCRRHSMPPEDGDWRRWVALQKRDLVYGRPAWGTVTVMHNATERFLAWWDQQCGGSSGVGKFDPRFHVRFDGGRVGLKDPTLVHLDVGFDPYDPASWPPEMRAVYGHRIHVEADGREVAW